MIEVTDVLFGGKIKIPVNRITAVESWGVMGSERRTHIECGPFCYFAAEPEEEVRRMIREAGNAGSI